MRMEKELRRWVMYQANAELEHNASNKRRDVVLNVLAQFARSGDAERYIRRDGHIAWRATAKFREWLEEGEWECEERDDAA